MMRKTVKIALITLSSLLLVFGLCSCGKGQSGVDDNVVYSPDVETVLVLGAGVDEGEA